MTLSHAPAECRALLCWFLLPLGLYLGIHLGLRLLISESLGYDEAEQVVWSQTLAWGYGPQPPLYTWLLWGLNQLCGVSLFTLALMKTATLGAIYCFLYLCAREMLADLRLVCLAVFSLLLTPLIAWGSLKGSTHSDLLCAVCLASFWMTLRLLATGRTSTYLGLGVLAGLGMLSKYNYAWFAAALLAGALTLPGGRARLFDRRSGLTAVVAICVVLPHALWAADHWDMIQGYLTMRMHHAHTPSWLAGVGGALGSLVYRLWGMLCLPLVAWLVFFPQGRRATPHDGQEGQLLLSRCFAAAGVFLLLAIACGTTHFLPRWLQPFLALAPLAFFVRLDPAALSRQRWQGFAGLLVLAAVGVMAGRVGQLYFGSEHGGRYRARDLAFARSVARIQAAGFRGGILISRDSLTGANLRLRFPQARLLCTDYPNCQAPRTPVGAPCLVVWNASQDDLAPALQAYLAPQYPATMSMEAAVRIEQALSHGGQCAGPVEFQPLP